MDKIKKPLFSIILPIYNVEQHLPQSLDSIFCQDTSDCEIILVNDGSTDDSLSIAKEYEDKYSNVRVIDKANEGVSTTRNRGLEECKGEYFYFMDSDDIIHPKLLMLVRKEIKSTHPDMVVWDYATFYTTPQYIDIPDCPKIEQVNNEHKEAFNYLMEQGSGVSLWNKVILRNLVGDIVRINPSMTYGEDMFFCWKTTLLAKNIRYIRLPLYYYLQSGNSATKRFHPALYEHYRKAFDDLKTFVIQQGMTTKTVLSSIDYFFARCIPSLARMETMAPYNWSQQEKHLARIIADEYIQRGLDSNESLNSKIFQLARKGDVRTMLWKSRLSTLKWKLLYPLKKLLK